MSVSYTHLDVYKRQHIEIENFSDEISSEGVEKIFEPFYRENTKKSRELGGNGLGPVSYTHLFIKDNMDFIETSNLDNKGFRGM